MNSNNNLLSFCQYGWHKGFYTEDDISDALFSIQYEDFLDIPDDDEFPYYSVHELLRGSCNHFVLGLKKVLGYTPYIIEGKKSKSFHAFAQIYNEGTWFYVDARGITSSFDEFMEVAKEFVSGEYTIRPVDEKDIDKWKTDDDYYEEAQAFAVAVIEKYKGYYTL